VTTVIYVEYLGLVVLAYLVGAIPTGFLAVRLKKGLDVREVGSGRTGATNARRVLGTKWFVVVLLADVAKGGLMVLLARWLFQAQLAEVLAAMAALVGHNWSIYLRGTGGRGVSTAMGGLLAMSPLGLVITLVVGVPIILVSRYVSLGSIIGAASSIVVMAGLVVFAGQPVLYFIYALLAGILVIVQHRDNIQRLLAGEERKLEPTAEQ
jgi:acyl phosphate:glycerol-3-phosphate acyltransferase